LLVCELEDEDWEDEEEDGEEEATRAWRASTDRSETSKNCPSLAKPIKEEEEEELMGGSSVTERVGWDATLTSEHDRPRNVVNQLLTVSG
jgi:hypothetical protein